MDWKKKGDWSGKEASKQIKIENLRKREGGRERPETWQRRRGRDGDADDTCDDVAIILLKQCLLMLSHHHHDDDWSPTTLSL